MLVVRLFGAGQASYLDQNLAGFPNQQMWLLLSYLLLNKLQTHSRERLAAVFWGDSPAHIARKNFRNTLYRLRQVLALAGGTPEDYLHINENNISFISYSPHWLDVEEFEAAAPYAQIAEQKLLPDQVGAMESAVDLYCGDLLENIYEDWCLYERERLRLVYLNMLYKLMMYYAGTSRYDLGLQFGERLLYSDNTREDVHRQMMWMFWRSGNRSAALSQYKLCCQVLRDEAGAVPMEQTRHLYQELLHDAAHPADWAKPAASLPAAAEPDLLPVAETALHQLKYLQQVLEQTNDELLKIEQLIHQAVTSSRRT
jgi:DNA-binding SARP family transcriptional activator